MQENNFEKQVQQKTDELKLQPSDEVWQKVAVAIAKRKNDRRILLIVFLLLLFISSAIFIIWDQGSVGKINMPVSEKNDPAKSNNIQESTNDGNTQEATAGVNSPNAGSKHPAGDKITGRKEITLTKRKTDQQKKVAIHLPVKTINSFAGEEPGGINKIFITKDKDAKRGLYTNKNKVKAKTGRKPGVEIGEDNPVDLTSERIVSNEINKTSPGSVTVAINDATIKERIPGSVSKNKIDIEKGFKDTAGQQLKMVIKKDPPVKNLIRSNQKSEWKIGFNFSLGVTATQNGYLGIIGSNNNDESKVYSAPNQSNGGSVGQGSYTSNIPSKIKAGTGLVLGVYVQKDISPRANFLFGLNYKTYTSAMMIGNRIDSSSYLSLANFFYRSGNTKRYKNHFHFLELPVAVRYKLSRQDKVPVYLNTGVSISRLVGSNALQFDTLTGSYYNDKAPFNKTLVNVSAGLLFSLSGHAKDPLLIGPEINFSLNKMASSGLYKNRHYSYFGILVQKTIGKK